jgi:hypothetical protein
MMMSKKRLRCFDERVARRSTESQDPDGPSPAGALRHLEQLAEVGFVVGGWRFSFLAQQACGDSQSFHFFLNAQDLFLFLAEYFEKVFHVHILAIQCEFTTGTGL